ncbi:MAG TPA: hybrid sensor histidine kinase/response regulator [Devosia sp.]|nr:hybrid sensor histidine kinase/response regulator [Devosia sp.]
MTSQPALTALLAEQRAELERLQVELIRTREQAHAASTDRTRFLAAASHDLLQPLNAARLYTSTLIERTAGSPFEHLAHSIEASLNTVEEIMSALLDISRLDSGAVHPAPTIFSARELLDKVLVEFTPAAREKNVTLRIVPTSVPILSDRVMIGRIVQNLVSNAIKYTPAGGEVLVGARRRGGSLRLDVIDTGIGFVPAQHDLIFTEFTRLESGARIARGLGLGLSIVKRLVATLGLGLDVDSVPGKGSRFSVFLPVSTRPAVSRAAGSGPAAVPIRPLDLKVLCVDNEEIILNAMAALLGGWGCDVRVATSLRAIAREKTLDLWLPDLILMDFHLDQTSGLDAIEWLHQNLGGHIPAALLTADRSETVRKLAAARNIPILHKPIKPAALRALVTSMGNGNQRDQPEGVEASVSS